MKADLFLAVDGGNTKTVAIVARDDGTALGAGRAGASDFYATPTEDVAFDEIGRAIRAALREAGANIRSLRTAAFSLAGADWPEDFADLRAGIVERGWCAEPLIVNDAIGALYSGSPAGVGVVLVAGTGMAIGARSACGQIWHSSNWPTAGGGWGLGKAALEAVYAAALEVGPETSLTAAVLALYGEATVEGVLHRRTARRRRRRHMDEARLAPLVLDEAEAGDPVAIAIVEGFGRQLGLHAVAAARRVGLGPEPFPLVLAGGVFRHRSRRYLAAMLAPLEAAFPGIQPLPSRFEPVAGALLLAMNAAGIAPCPGVLDRIEATMPPPELFHT